MSQFAGASDLFGQPPPRVLSYLDPELLVGSTEGGGSSELQGEFICVVCTGVVLDPVECKECSSLYCKGCLTTMNMPCPKRCGGADYTKVNRLVMNQLNRLPFKCQFNPKCTKEVTYDQYMVHFKECPEGKPKECENPDC
jgi:hypothetical protein